MVFVHEKSKITLKFCLSDMLLNAYKHRLYFFVYVA